MILNGHNKSFIKHRNRMIKQLFVALLVTVICTWILFQIDESTGESLVFNPSHVPKEISSPGFLVNTKGCRIHDLDPFDPSIMKYIYNEHLNCDKQKKMQLVKATTNELYVDEENRKAYVDGTNDALTCCFQPFWRVELNRTEKPYHFDNTFDFSDDCFSFYERVEVLHEFVKVMCTQGNKTIYKDYFAFAQKKMNKSINPNDRSKVSVLTFGFDAVSRLNLHRQLPNTIQLLQDLGAVEMLGYNKVEDNTFPNLIPVLTGYSVEEIKKICWRSYSWPFDGCKFIWNYFEEEGYQTGYGEDSSNIGLFNYLKNGFRKKPTDFYMRAFSMVAEQDIGSERWLNCYICLGNRLTIQSILDAAKSFSFILKDILSFGFFWSNSLSHDYLNLPRYADEPFFNFFTELKNNGILDKSVVVFLSDHGIRWGKFRSTYHGYVEERLPFLYILYPNWFNSEFPHAVSNLRRNRRRLTSPYDLHETYKHLLDLSSLKKDALKLAAKEKGTKGRGTSLFLPISEDRTCSDAGIPFNWCTCHESTPEKLDETNVLTSATVLINYLNDLLSGYRQCSKLTLGSVERARSENLVGVEKKIKNLTVTDYIVTVKTNPGGGLFQGTVRFFRQTQNFEVLTPVSRINTYGNQSTCISNYQLKLYCYCLDLW